ncbi:MULTISPECIES: fumarylacetoacetate hydrolase family protein [Mycolicibacterium]
MRLGEAGAERPAVEHDGTIYDLSPLTTDIDGSFLASNGVAAAREALVQRRLQPVAAPHEKRVGAPVARPSAVVCIGQNYAAHAAETGSPPPSAPIVFFKHPNTVVGPHDTVLIPPGATRVDWEVELAVVIGKRARYLDSAAESADYIAGYTVSNDVSERDYQIVDSGGQWSKGKCCETFNPLGPYLVPADEVPDPQSLRLWSSVNGQARQDSCTSDMIFSVAETVWHLSQYLVLEPGDIINTGTPQGVALSGRFPYLSDGDVMRIGIERLGEQAQQLAAAGR